MSFIDENFLLHHQAARDLYQEFARPEPIFDFHSHLSPRDIAEDRQFNDLSELWLEGDHYKWRAMRANGVAETFCTGAASPKEKFLAWAATVPRTLRNPLYYWTHLELLRYFGIDELLNENSAEKIWVQANEKLRQPEWSARGLLQKFAVKTLCTTDDPTDDLRHHARIAGVQCATRVFPTFRPDKALLVNRPEQFNGWVDKLTAITTTDAGKWPGFLSALRARHDDFHAHGCRMSDHGLSFCPAAPCEESEAAEIFLRARSGHPATGLETSRFATFMMLFFSRLDAEKGWVKQLHLGALRNPNSSRLAELGPDTGFDGMGDFTQGEALAGFLDLLARERALPKIIIYNSNPRDNHLFATVAGSFPPGPGCGGVHFGAAWWFLDQKAGIEAQLNALSNIGLLSRFPGMVTDSRSFMSFPRHEYFRRVLCNLVGREMEQGELPNDLALVGDMIRRICYHNAQEFFPVPPNQLVSV